MYIIHHRLVGGGVRIAFATFFPLLLTFNTKVLCVLKSGAPFNTDQYLLYVPNYLEFNLSVSEFMVLKIYNVKKKVLPLSLLDSGIPGVRSTYSVELWSQRFRPVVLLIFMQCFLISSMI